VLSFDRQENRSTPMAANNEWLMSLLMGLGRMFPMFIVWFIGLVIALVRWPRCPGVSALVVAAIGLAGVTSIATHTFYMWLPRSGQSLQSNAAVVAIVGIVSASVHAGAWGCMLAAAFMGRDSMPDQTGFSDATKTPAGKA
jgi:hypothetical protein